MVRISVIVPIYNSKAFLEQCIESIIAQTYSELEIILVDDGSNDGSEKLCDEYAKKDHRIKVIHKPNGGLVSARQIGINVATGKYIGFVDSDDWIEPDMYEKLVYHINKYDVDVAMCGRFEDSDFFSKPVYQGIDEGLYVGDELRKHVFPRMIVNEQFFEWGLFPSYWDKLFKRDIIMDHILAVDERIVMGEDASGVFPCLLNSKSIYVRKECLYHYRQTSNSMVRKRTDAEIERNRFRLLYDTTKTHLDAGKEIYDFSEQWKKYVLFLMTPRADVLYEKIDELDYLFPFPRVKKGDKVLIYGAGLWGKRVYDFLKKTNFCQVVAIADRNYKNISKENFNVISPDDISRMYFDAIIVPSSYSKTRKAIVKELREKYIGAYIYEPDEEEISSDRTMHAFGLI